MYGKCDDDDVEEKTDEVPHVSSGHVWQLPAKTEKEAEAMEEIGGHLHSFENIKKIKMDEDAETKDEVELVKKDENQEKADEKGEQADENRENTVDDQEKDDEQANCSKGGLEKTDKGEQDQDDDQHRVDKNQGNTKKRKDSIKSIKSAKLHVDNEIPRSGTPVDWDE